jgi:hypothetical protein
MTIMIFVVTLGIIAGLAALFVWHIRAHGDFI